MARKDSSLLKNALYIRGNNASRKGFFRMIESMQLFIFKLFQRIQERIAFQWKSTVKIMIMKLVMCY